MPVQTYGHGQDVSDCFLRCRKPVVSVETRRYLRVRPARQQSAWGAVEMWYAILNESESAPIYAHVYA